MRDLLKHVPSLMAILAVAVMVYISNYFDLPELMLPTFGALLTGAWLVPENLWHYSRIKLLISLPMSAMIGFLLSLLIGSHHYLYVYPCLYAGFLLTATVLILGRTQIYPCFGAAALPILFQTTNWFYPVSVCVMAVVLVLGRMFLVKIGVRRKLTGGGFSERRRERFVYYAQTSAGLLPALILVPIIGDHYMLLPPFFVTYATFCNAKSTFTKYPVQTWCQLVISITVGSFACLLGCMMSEFFPAYQNLIPAGFSGVSVFVTICFGRYVFHRLFPPAMSLAVTPFLIHFNPWVILYVAVVGAYLIFIAWVMRSHPAYQNRDLKYL